MLGRMDCFLDSPNIRVYKNYQQFLLILLLLNTAIVILVICIHNRKIETSQANTLVAATPEPQARDWLTLQIITFVNYIRLNKIQTRGGQIKFLVVLTQFIKGEIMNDSSWSFFGEIKDSLLNFSCFQIF